MKRRNFILAFFAGVIFPSLLSLLNKFPSSLRVKRYLRPPGAKPEREFQNSCIGCAQCANVCPNKCITMLGLEAGLENLATPSITARAKGCILCMACTQVCPTDALEKLECTEEGIEAVNMGKAFVAEDIWLLICRTNLRCLLSCVPASRKSDYIRGFRTTSHKSRSLRRVRFV